MRRLGDSPLTRASSSSLASQAEPIVPLSRCSNAIPAINVRCYCCTRSTDLMCAFDTTLPTIAKPA